MSKIWRFLSKLRPATLGLLLLAAPGTSIGESGAQPLDSIIAAAEATSRARAEQYGFDNVSVEVRPLDGRLRLPACGEELKGAIPQTASVPGTVSVRVSCAEPKPWSIYVRSRVIAQRSVPVLAHPLARGAVVTENDIKMVNMPVDSVVNGIIFDPRQILGMELVRPLNSGTTFRVNQLRQPNVIKRGQVVTLRAGAGGLQVEIQGKALSDATEGERVRVSNLTSGRQVEGTANSDGSVTVR